MEIIGCMKEAITDKRYMPEPEPPVYQKYSTVCKRCGSVLVFADNEVKFSTKPFCIDRLVKCPKCGREITVFKEKRSWFSAKLILAKNIAILDGDSYMKLKNKYQPDDE